MFISSNMGSFQCDSFEEYKNKLETCFQEENEIWCSKTEDNKYPCLSVLVKDSQAVVNYFETEDDGEMLVITGPNGGGKSTLAKVLMGIEEADEGRIILDGEDITAYDINHRADAGLGFAFQQPPRFKGMTVIRLLSLAAGRELKEQECCGLLSRVGLCAQEYVRREVDATLSGGEMKRLEIATVLAKPHKLCIFDEPEAGIDLWSFSMLIHEFEKIHRKKAESLILISHQERIIQMADRIMVIENGTIGAVGPREEILPGLLDKGTGCTCMNAE